MELLRQIFTKKADPKPANKFKKLDAQPAEALEALVAGSQGDPDDIDIRVAALKRLPYTMAVRNAALSAPPVLEKAARLHLAGLVDAGQLSIEQLMRDIDDTDKQLVIASYCRNSELQNVILEKIEDQKVLANVCSNTPSAAVRKALAGRIEDPELLRGLLKAFKNKDKNAYKIIKTKLDDFKAEEDARMEMQNKIRVLCADIEKHSQRLFDQDYISRMERCTRRWAEVEPHAQDPENQRFAIALTACRERIQAVENEQQERVEQDIVVSEAVANRKALLNGLWEFLQSVYQWDTSGDTRQEAAKNTLVEQQQKWRELEQLGTANERHNKQYRSLCDALERLLRQFAEKGTLRECYNRISAAQDAKAEPASEDIQHLRRLLAPLPRLNAYPMGERKENDTIIAAQAVISERDAREKEQRQFWQKQVRVVGGLIRKSHTAVDQGRLKQALGIRHSINEKFFGMDNADDLPANLTAQLESLDEALQKLVDWQAYAVVPKKEALVKAMEALVGVDLPPEALATKIKKLQEEWSSLSQSGKDRKEDLWQRFSDAADKAYEPCKEYYRELSALRRKNLQKRQTLVKQLQDYARENDWDNADWRQVEKVLHSARKELHSYAPVERSANKSLLTTFDDAMSVIQGKLEAEYDKNKRSKEQLVMQAEQLGVIADFDQATEAAKRLQAQWKNIGRCSYRENERLWKEFRKHCDSLFAKKESLMAEQNAVLNGNLAKARELIEALKKIATLSGEEFLATRAEKDRIKQAFAEVGELPAKADKVTRRNFAQTLETYEDKVKQQLRRADQDAWLAMFSVNAEINAWQMAVNANNAEAPSIKEAIDAGIAAMARWPEGTLSKIKRKLECQPEGSPDENQKALRLLCIRTEILADVASPAEDKAQRMEYQVNLLQHGLGQAATSSPESLALEWVAVGPVTPESYQALYQRFHTLWQKLI